MNSTHPGLFRSSCYSAAQTYMAQMEKDILDTGFFIACLF
jgi:hypothetical protein